MNSSSSTHTGSGDTHNDGRVSPVPGQPVSNFYMGADLRQAQDYTALAILEHIWGKWVIEAGILDVASLEVPDMRYHLRHLERLLLGTSYPRQVEIIKQRFDAIPLSYRHSVKSLLVDATGVGRAVIDMMREAGLSMIPIVITVGNATRVVELFIGTFHHFVTRVYRRFDARLLS